jgi:hypothetical protein
MGAVLTVTLLVAQPGTTPSLDRELIVGVGTCCFGWWFVLQASHSSPLWSALLAILVAPQLFIFLLESSSQAGGAKAAALALGLGSYVMVWALSVIDTQRALQSVATMALLLPLAFFSRIEVLMLAAFAGLILWLACGRRFGGYKESGLLVFTPLLLCVSIVLVLRSLGIAMIHNPASVIDFDFYWVRLWRYQPLNACRVASLIPALMLGFAALWARMIERRASIVDLTYTVSVLALLAGIVLPPVSPDPRILLNAGMIACGGAMPLLAGTQRRRIADRISVITILSFGLIISLRRF